MKFLKIAILFIGITSFAQSKVGVADIEYIVSQMPEMEEVQEEIKAYAIQLDTDFNVKLSEYNELQDAYEKGKDNFGEEERKQKQMELMEKENDIQKFQKNGLQLMEIKRQEIYRPLYKKVGVALNKVAEEQKYTYVTKVDQDMVYLDSNYDLTDAILTEMGIEITQGTTEE